MKKKRMSRCDFPGCAELGKRLDIPTSWFRGDDVVLIACTEHRKKHHHVALLDTPKAKKQMEAS